MNNIFNLVRKELDKVFRNPRAVFTNFIMPGLLILIIYMSMGSIMSAKQDSVTASDIKIAVVNPSGIFNEAFTKYNNALVSGGANKLNFEFVNIDDINIDDFRNIIKYKTLENPTEEETAVYNRIMNSIGNQEYDAWLCFNKDFDEKYLAGNTDPKDKAVVGLFGKATLEKSSYAQSTLSAVIELMQPKTIQISKIDFSTNTEFSQKMMSTMVPMFLIIFIFAGGMAVGADSIAGEKERGTIATLLMTPIKRSNIIVGKIISLIVLTIVSAIGPFLAIIISMPQMMKSMGVGMSGSFGLTVTSAFQIFLLVLLTALLATALFLLLSTIAKNIKEATVFITPVYMLVIVLTVLTTTMNIGGNIGFYFVPFMNIAIGINSAIMGTLGAIPLICISLSSIAYFGILLALAIKLFNKESVIFSK